mgnify:FL=1
MKGVQQIREFGEFMDLKKFERRGYADLDGYRVAGIPVLIHPDPERTVGMGDIISAGSFGSEVKLQEN